MWCSVKQKREVNKKGRIFLMKLNRIMIAAPKSGSGKTMITCALLQLLKNQGHQVVSYKCGPDYIDPMFHEKVLHIPAKNLDTFFTDEEQTKALFLQNRTEQEFAIMEGVMGLYDGLGGIREEGSSYHLAQVTDTPIILVVDAKGMGRSLIPFIAGFLAYDKKHFIKGVLLNRMSKSYYDMLKPLIEEELSIKVLGYVPDMPSVRIESRHLGLVMPQELSNLQQQLQEMAETVSKTIDVEQLIELARKADCIETNLLQDKQLVAESRVASVRRNTQLQDSDKLAKEDKQKVRIAVAKDEAFCFYYADNLRLLQEYGAELVCFSPIHDEELPQGCHAILLGGGYPELYAKQLSENVRMKCAIKQTFEEKMPMVAECGGFMYLHDKIIDKDQNCYEMAGVLSAECRYTGKLVRFGYIELTEQKEYFLPKNEEIRGHEFHYFDSTQNGDGYLARKPVTGRKYPCVVTGETYWLGFPHLYYPSNPTFAKAFVAKARAYRYAKG